MKDVAVWGSDSTWSDAQWETADGGNDYWIGYADVLAGLLMVFALMLVTALYHYQGRVTEVRDLLETRRAIITQLQERFGEATGVNVTIDSTSGSVEFDGQVLFNEGEAVLLPDGREQLSAFAEEYLPLLLGTERFREQLRAIVIEGHTNDNAPPDNPRPYMFNLALSQQRAFNVMAFLIENASTYERELKEYVTANGRSFADPVCLDDAPCGEGEPGVVDDVRSRRIEIYFRLNDEEVIRQIMERLFLS